jgi:tRNA threonylcarbamoyladenosine biosynthesis protein TsaB
MTIVGLDTSLPTTTVCVLRDDGEAYRTPPPSEDRLLGPAEHSRELLPEVERLMRESGIGWSEVHAIAVGVGPGTFTGLRIGIATARALAQALDVPIHPVSSLQALAAGALETAGAGRQPVLALIDARRHEVFAALYRAAQSRGANDAPGRLPGPEELWPPAVTPPGALLQRILEPPDAPICVGDWALRSRVELEGAGADVPDSESGLHAVDALSICRLAAGVEPVRHQDVYPVYLRVPDAEKSKARKDKRERAERATR